MTRKQKHCSKNFNQLIFSTRLLLPRLLLDIEGYWWSRESRVYWWSMPYESQESRRRRRRRTTWPCTPGKKGGVGCVSVTLWTRTVTLPVPLCLFPNHHMLQHRFRDSCWSIRIEEDNLTNSRRIDMSSTLGWVLIVVGLAASIQSGNYLTVSRKVRELIIWWLISEEFFNC